MSTGVTQWVTPDCHNEHKTSTKNKLILGNLSDKHCSKWFICITYVILPTTPWGWLLLWPSFTDEGLEAHQMPHSRSTVGPGDVSQALTTPPGLSLQAPRSPNWPTRRLVLSVAQTDFSGDLLLANSFSWVTLRLWKSLFYFNSLKSSCESY